MIPIVLFSAKSRDTIFNKREEGDKYPWYQSRLKKSVWSLNTVRTYNRTNLLKMLQPTLDAKCAINCRPICGDESDATGISGDLPTLRAKKMVVRITKLCNFFINL